MRRKLLCMLLAASMVFSSTVPAFAEDGEQISAALLSETDAAEDDTSSSENVPVVTDLGEATPGATDPGEATPVVTDPGEATPGVTDPGTSTPGTTDPSDPVPPIGSGATDSTNPTDPSDPSGSDAEDPQPVQYSISYRTAINELGWRGTVKDGKSAGKTGEGYYMESFWADITGSDKMNVSYSAYVKGQGWQTAVAEGQPVGIVGSSAPLEAIKLELTGEDAALYDVYYRTYIKGVGWMGWTKNGSPAGQVGYSRVIQAVMIQLVEKDAAAPGSTATPYREKTEANPYSVTYKTHVNTGGWRTLVKDGKSSGRTGKGYYIDGLCVNVTGDEYLNVSYKVYQRDLGWSSTVKGGATAGKIDNNSPVDAIKISLTGQDAHLYDVYYRTYIREIGWLGWTKNGVIAGTTDFNYSMQAIQVKICEKNSAEAPTESTAYVKKVKVNQQGFVIGSGWTEKAEVTNSTIGTTSGSGNLGAFQLTTSGVTGVGIQYRSYVTNVGWQSYAKDGEASGRTANGKTIEAVQIKLTGEKAADYDVYYRVYLKNLGWIGWAKNGQTTGSYGCKTPIKAMQVKILAKGQSAPGATSPRYFKIPTVNYQISKDNAGWEAAVTNNKTAGAAGKTIDRFKANIPTANLGIQYKAYITGVGWQVNKADGVAAGRNNKNMEIIRMNLTGSLSKYYNVWYRVFNSEFGWMGWAKNGGNAGTATLSIGIEAVQVCIRLKSQGAPGSTTNPYRTYRTGWTYIDGFRRYIDDNGNVMNDVSSIFNPYNKRITVDCYRGITTIYGYNSETGSYDTPIKAFYCSVGRPGHETPSGNYQIYRKYSSKIMNGVNNSYHVWAPYISCFNGTIYFHGVASIDVTPDQIAQSAWEALGSPASSGCVRLAGIEAKWLYENCPVGTVVTVGSYNSPMPCPMTAIRYGWEGGIVDGDPTL